MGILEHEKTGRRLSLGARSLVGRAPGCVIRLDDPRISAEHASIFWTGARWEVRDLGSRNGTFFQGRRLAAGERQPLLAGSELAFGAEDRWILAGALPPVASAIPVDGGAARVAEDGLLVLPSAAEPLASLFEDDAGRWLIETDGPARAVDDQERLEIGTAWILSVPPAGPAGVVPTTLRAGQEAPTLASVILRFTVSRDEEFVELAFAHGDRVTPLSARSHTYLLLTLARAHLRDREAGQPLGEQGWLYVEELGAMVTMDASQLNLAIFRARQQLAQAGIANAGALVERRSTSRQIRLGTGRVEVVSG